MTRKFHHHYENGFQLASMGSLLWETVSAKTKRRRMAALHRFQDYLTLQKHPKLFELHRDLHLFLEEGVDNWDSYDYGEGYFYQSLNSFGITGFRDTGERYKTMELADTLEGMTVLEIGCNTGFLSSLIARTAEKVIGFDLAPHLVKIAERITQALKVENLELSVASFEEFKSDEQFDAVLSFANHSTLDGNSTLDLETYFDRCRQYLKPEGLFLFESHPPELEDADKLSRTCALIEARFEVQSKSVLNYGTFLDQNRTFLVAKPR